MDLNKDDENKSNRRRALRIYEQVDLFYQKIKYNPDGEIKPVSNDAILSDTQNTEEGDDTLLLPNSYSSENDTLNINISSSGISFTAKEELVPGDYLMMRVLLLSSMTVIMTCCKVVYCKPSNPFENNQYPYLAGAEFVNLKSEDQERLHRYIKSRRRRRLIVYGLLFCLFLTVIQIPDLVLELFLNLISFVFDELIEIAHLLYEIIEYGLDEVVEHVFHTGLHETQTIVFYIQMLVAAAIAYPVFKAIISICKKLITGTGLFFFRKKSSLCYCWGQQVLWYKIGLVSAVIAVIVLYGLFLI